MSVLTILVLNATAVAAAGAATPVLTSAGAGSAAAVSPSAAIDAPARGTLATAHAAPAAKPHCDSTRPQYGDTMQVQCALGPSDTPRKFKFEVRFLGGHDDTRASLSATFNGQPLTCDEGSKPQLEGEFGEVSIHCQFSVRDAQTLKVDVVWYHAQYSEFVLEPM